MPEEINAVGAVVPVAEAKRRRGAFVRFAERALSRRLAVTLCFTVAMFLLVFAGCCFAALNGDLARLIVRRPGVSFCICCLLFVQTAAFIFGFTVFGRVVSAAASALAFVYVGCAVYTSVCISERILVCCAAFLYALSAANSFFYSANAFAGSARLFDRKLLQEYLALHFFAFFANLIIYFII